MRGDRRSRSIVSVGPASPGQLRSQEQDFRAEGRARAEQETEERKAVCDQPGDQLKQRIQ
jgi:hypothetical protein